MISLTVRYILMPKIVGNASKTNTKVIQLGFATLANKILNETTNVSYGFVYNNQLFGPFIVPLLGYYTKQNHIEVNVLFPQNIDINYKLKPNIFFGLKFNGKMNSYALESNTLDLNQSIPKVLENQIGSYLDYNYKKFSSKLIWRLFIHVVI